MDWIRKNQPLGWKMRFYDTQVHFLSPEGAYTVSLGEEEIEGERTESRVTLFFLKKEGEWWTSTVASPACRDGLR